MNKPFDHVHRCTDCRLRETASRVVVGDGYLNAKAMIVGEAPGRQEDTTGIAFVGAAGGKLWTTFGMVGLSRRDFYVTNVLKCRPPDNADPRPDWIAACRKHLQYQIKVVRPLLIVPIGRYALKWFMGTSAPPISQACGKKYKSKTGIVLTPLVHPAWVLRNPKAEELLVHGASVVADTLDRLIIETSDTSNLFKPRR